MKHILKVFFGVCLMLFSGILLLYNLFLLPTGFDIALGVIDVFLFFCGLFLTVFSTAKIPREN